MSGKYTTPGGSHGIPKVHYKGRQGEYYVMVMDILVQVCGMYEIPQANRCLLPEMVSCIAVESLSILEKLHAKGYFY
ncbi:casein kinase 1-like protein HD16 isoform X2 [Cicer arietinum]|uniref:casein kinase 1-like protein HD16 isoform X2 n=1 Tax=Cicer arietinum TaxID=3827 RepID=UPI003CC6A42C